MYENDLPAAIDTDSVTCYLYADDVCITSVSKKIIIFTSNLFKDWCNANCLSLNLGKTQELDISYD